jgi:tyrosyl-tRNA synthetase
MEGFLFVLRNFIRRKRIMSVLDTLKERGFVQQTTHQEPLFELLEREKVTFYIGFDPTADSLHVGHLLQAMVMAHMQRAGHRPIVILGEGTAMIGDPSGRTDLRQMLTRQQIAHNAACFKDQLSRMIDFTDGKALMISNGDWLLQLNYIEFLRNIGKYFSVNRMLTAECFRSRLERGLSFIEFNYMLLQSYDFLVLYQKYGCKLQMGGDDQWSNILYGVDLVRRVEGGEAFGITLPLLTTSSGVKMGKTAAGAVWLDPEKTSPYEFYQYWRNTDDRDVQRFLALYTFLPMEEVRRLGGLRDRAINEAKKVLAFEVTQLIHGTEAAQKACQAAEALFGGADNEDAVPALDLSQAELEAGINLIDLVVTAELAPSKSEARRLITQGGIGVNEQKITDIHHVVGPSDAINGKLTVKKGKKQFRIFKIIS